MKATRVQCEAKGMMAVMADLPRVQAVDKYSKEYKLPAVKSATQGELCALVKHYREKRYA